MIDFWYECKIKTTGRAIYIENGHVRSGHSNFQFDMAKLARHCPELRFYCTANPNCDLPNVVNCEKRNLIEMSFISNQCEAIVGKGSGPFMCTLTEANRKKPKAVMAFIATPFWLYRDNPLQYLANEDALMNFLENIKNNPLEVI
jgi:hypothetical protein